MSFSMLGNRLLLTRIRKSLTCQRSPSFPKSKAVHALARHASVAGDAWQERMAPYLQYLAAMSSRVADLQTQEKEDEVATILR